VASRCRFDVPRDPGARPPAGADLNVSDSRRATLAGLADVLIPAGGAMPSASEAGVAGRWLDAFLSIRPELGDDLARILDEAAGRDPAGVIRSLAEAEDGADFAVLSTVVPGAYYLDPAIRVRLGYPGQEAVPIPEPSLDSGDEELVQSVIDRGPIFRS
jgi:hypothetical protein